MDDIIKRKIILRLFKEILLSWKNIKIKKNALRCFQEKNINLNNFLVF